MEEIKIDVSGLSATLREASDVVCNNSGYAVHFYTDASWSDSSPLYADIRLLRSNSEQTVRVPVVESVAAFPTLTGETYAVEIVLYYSDDVQTNAVWVECEQSILSYNASEEVVGFDVYNKACEMLRRRISPERYHALLAELTANYENPVLPPKSAYIDAVMAESRITRLTGTVKLPNGNTIALDNENIVENSVSVSTNAMTDDAMLPGGVPSAELKIGLIADLTDADLLGAEIDLTVHQRLSSTAWYPVQIGTYTVRDAADSSVKGIDITAYDDMDRLGRVSVSDIPFASKVLYAPQQILEMCAEAAGVEYDGSVNSGYANSGSGSVLMLAFGLTGAVIWWPLPIYNADEITDIQAALDERYPGAGYTYVGDADYKNELPDKRTAVPDTVYKVSYSGPYYAVSEIGAGVETARDLISCVAQTLCAFAYFDRNRKLTIKPIADGQAARTYTPAHKTQTRITGQQYKLYALIGEYEIYDDETNMKRQSDQIYRTFWSDGVTVRMRTNPLLTTISGTGDGGEQYLVIREITDTLETVVFYPLSMETYDDADLALFDWVSVDGRLAPITQYTWRYHGRQQLACCGAETIAGEIRSQAEKAASAIKENAYKDARTAMRNSYLMMIKTYRGMQPFRYRQLQYFDYRDFKD